MTHKLQLVTLDQRGKERIEMSSVSIFTHVLLTAPSHSIAEVYRIQLNILKQSVPFLATSSVVCVSDPEHGRVGSGGGTLNALQQLKIACGVRSYESCRVLVIHSGGESRRAPLNSLCGKAWTSINATVEGDVMASPLLLLIKELNLFCMNLPLGSLVIASSDVTLDIANKSCSRLQFDEHCVFAVAVPVAPSIAKNHGVLVPFSFYFPGRQSEFEGGCTIDHVTRYFQKPTFEIMEENGALFSPHELGQASSDDSPNNTKVALVDTGVVIFCGEALGKLVSLLDDPVVRTCVEGAQQQQQTSASATLGQPLRLELYTDIMLALAVKDQSDFCISEYHHRLGVKASDLPAQSLYKQALPVLWEALKYTPLQVIIVPQGRFEHLGTTAEVLQLLTLVDGVSSTVKSPSIPTTAAGVHDAQLAKLRAFALKYHLRRHVKSTVRCLHPRNAQQSEEQQILAMCINSILMMQGEDDSSSESAKRPLVGEAKTTTVDRLHVLVEHSALSGKISFPGTAIASHICPALGKDLTLRDGIMMQQVHLKLDHERELATPFSLPCAMIVLGISDDVKLPFSRPFAKICGAPWTRLFQVSTVSPADLWNAAVPESDRSLWTAQLFPEFHLDSAGSCSVRAQCGKLLSAAPRLALTWLQDLPNLEPTFDCSDSTSESDNCGKCSESNNGLPVAYVEAVGCWRQAKRVSLADILSTGNATGMLHWRTWLQVAHDSDYHGSSRVERLLGVDKLNSDLFAGFFHVAAFLRSCEMQGGFMVSPCAVLLALWLSNLCSPAQSAAQQGMCLLQVLRKVRPCADSDNIGSIKAFIALESKILSQGNPSIPHVLTAFLRSFVTEKVELLAVLQSLLVGVQFYPIYMHSRAVFLAAWLLKGRTLFVRTSDKQDILTQGDFGSANDHDKRPIDLQQQGVAVCLKVLQLVISTLARGKIAPDDSSDSELSAALEDIAQSFVALHMRYSLDCYSSAQTSAAFCGTIPSAPAPTSTPALEPVSGALSSSTNQGHKYAALRDCVVLSRAPVRVDLAGGWSDTPPICYEMSGAVLNVAVLVDSKHPIRCASRVTTAPIIHLRCKMLTAPEEYCTETFLGTKWSDFAHLSHNGSNSKCVLLRAVCVALGLVDTTKKIAEEEDLAAFLQRTCGGGITMMCVSGLPPGSGMGGSSVLAAAALHSLAHLLGVPVSQQDLVYLVSQVEQILTTGGGWQDQVGAIYGGFKLGTNQAALPLLVTVQSTTPSSSFTDAFHRRVFLVYTGQQRLAKNTLINALRRSALSPAAGGHIDTDTTQNYSEQIVCPSTVRALVANALDGWELLTKNCAAGAFTDTERDGDEQVDQLAQVLNRYWELKKEMAAGSEPPNIRRILDQLYPMCAGLALCGAGAGGFVAVILKRNFTQMDLQGCVSEINTKSRSSLLCTEDLLSVHTAEIDWHGIHSTRHAAAAAASSSGGGDVVVAQLEELLRE